jgi:hypothetical protein
MTRRETVRPDRDGGWTRAGLLRAAIGGGAAAAGGALVATRGGGTTAAAPTPSTDAEILNLLLTLEHAQEDFYRAALDADGLDGPLRAYAAAVVRQEQTHVAFLRDRLGSRARAHRPAEPGEAARSPAGFRSAAVRLEEAAVAAYVDQGASLTTSVMAAVAPLVSVEARQAAWIRHLAGVLPAPSAADPGRRPDAVLSDLRSRGLLR